MMLIPSLSPVVPDPELELESESLVSIEESRVAVVSVEPATQLSYDQIQSQEKTIYFNQLKFKILSNINIEIKTKQKPVQLQLYRRRKRHSKMKL